jgi:hypothetical protein
METSRNGLLAFFFRYGFGRALAVAARLWRGGINPQTPLVS